MVKVLADDGRMFKLHHDSYTIVAYPVAAITPRRRVRFQAFGAYFALHTLSTNRGPLQTSFALPLAMLLKPAEFIRLPLAYIRLFDAQAAQQLEPWVRLAKNSSFPKGHHPRNTPEDTALLNLLFEMDLNVSRAPQGSGKPIINISISPLLLKMTGVLMHMMTIRC